MRKISLFLFLLFMVFLLCSCAAVESHSLQHEKASSGNTSQKRSGYWPVNVSEEQIYSAAWSFDHEDLKVEGAESELTVQSVSPSGKYLAAIDRSKISIADRFAAGVANPFGRLPNAIYLFSRKGEKYHLYKTIPVDTETQLELSSLLGGGSAFAWNEEETCVIITGAWGLGSDSTPYIKTSLTNLYLLDLANGTIQRLTENSRPGEHCVLPQWFGEDTVRYLRTSCNDAWQNTLCETDLKTGTEKKLAELFCANGTVCPVFAWQIVGKKIYYTADPVNMEQKGFYVSPLNGKEEDALCLVNVFSELRETNKHPYCYSLSHFEISSDNRLVCLSIYDKRFQVRDIPLTDDELHPQNDPANAISVNGEPWVPCHNILLYDLKTEKLVDPFENEAMSPTKVIVMDACFAPDGKSLLCTVFGDDGSWTTSDFNRTSFYQINLVDGNYTAVKVFETELTCWFPKGIQWLKNNVLCIPTDNAPLITVYLVQPAVFRQYPD